MCLYDPTIGRLPRSLAQAARALRNRTESILKDCGLTYRQFEVLQLLDHRSGITLADISRTLKVTPQNITDLVYRMEDADLISCSWKPGSGRRLSVDITTDGLVLLRRAQSRMRVLDRSIRSALGVEATSSLVEELFALGNIFSASE
jgi:DNA-binding MarR family transcriptional regulator